MFNFKNLKLDKRESPENTSSFVGIRRNENNDLVFRLPKGFNDFPDNNFEETKNLFFKMYRTFKKFENDNKNFQTDQRSAGKDNIEVGGNAYSFKDKEENDVILYSKISVIENLLEAYRDLSLDVIERKIGRDEEIDYSKIDKYLHKAIYLEDDVIYIDEMELPRHFLQYKSASLIDLFCFILCELELELQQESDERVKELARRFKEQHLNHDQSLFNEETFDVTISDLKDSLDDIDKVTAYKDEDYWRLYEAIETFLYGELDMENPDEDGVFWGVSNFYQIWEDMCNTFAFSEFKPIYADTDIIFNGQRVSNCSFGRQRIYKKDDFENPFFIEFRQKKKWMRPDFVGLIDGNDNIFVSNGIRVNISSINNITNPYNKDKIKTVDFILSVEGDDDSILKNTIKKLKRKLISRRSNRKTKFGSNKVFNYPFSDFESSFGEYRNNASVFIFDWKYMDVSNYCSKNKKLDMDITKQLCYEFSMQKNSSFNKLESEFVIPFFFYENELNGALGVDVKDDNLYGRLKDSEITVFKADFNKIQEFYLNHG
ncbi:MAG: hypothetical protein GQ583_04800 [Methyloprofundus sp.]|nr:hypothetical protein [Methyloprofundus sp.]